MAVKQELLALLEQHRDASLSGEELARRLEEEATGNG